MLAFIFALYAFVIAGGLVFVYDPCRNQFLQIALLLQVPWISSPFLLYRFACASYAIVSAEPPQAGRVGLHFGWVAQFGSQANVGIFQGDGWSLGVNLFAVLLLVLLRTSTRKAPATIVRCLIG
jgi:hypothetical protein